MLPSMAMVRIDKQKQQLLDMGLPADFMDALDSEEEEVMEARGGTMGRGSEYRVFEIHVRLWPCEYSSRS